MSSAGLIYKHFGREIVKNLVNSIIEEYKDSLTVEIHVTQELLDTLYLRLYDSLIAGIDGIDNGVQQYPVDIKPAYSEKSSLGYRIGRLYPMWTEKNVDENIRFRSAIEIADSELRH